MKINIPRFAQKRLNEKITICVSKELKESWDKLVRVDKVQLPEMTREFLKETMPLILEQLKQVKQV